jgi:hypothetical protein
MRYDKVHKIFWKVCRDKDDYKSGKDTDNHNRPDCSCGCKWFYELDWPAGEDWGVCYCVKSPRAGLLTFEHMGCKYFEGV